MKQFKFLTIAAAMFTVVASLSSCFRDVDPVKPESVDISVEPQKYSLTVTSTAEADFSIDVPATAVPSADKKSVVFTDITTLDSTINITASLINPEGYVTPSQTAQVMFISDGINEKDIAFDFVKLSTETKTQEEVLNAITDVEVESNPAEYESQLVIPAGTEATGNTTDPYSMTCYAPAPKVINLFPKKNNASKTRGDGYDDDDDSHLGDDEGDEIILFTDGVSDVTDSDGKRFVATKLPEIIEENHELSAKEQMRLVVHAIKDFRGKTEITDDMTVIILKRKAQK